MKFHKLKGSSVREYILGEELLGHLEVVDDVQGKHGTNLGLDLVSQKVGLGNIIIETHKNIKELYLTFCGCVMEHIFFCIINGSFRLGLDPPLPVVSRHRDFMQVLFLQKYMFLKQEKPEMDDFEKEKSIGFKGKIFETKVLTDTLTKTSTKYFCIFAHLRIFKVFFYVLLLGETILSLD